MRAPAYNPYQHRYSAADIQQASQRCAELAKERPTWPRSRVRALVAREMKLSTVQLRYLLRQGSSQESTPPAAEALAA